MTETTDHSFNWKLSLLPRTWQREALSNWLANYKGIVSVVTGGGKTLFAFLCIIEYIKRYPEKGIIIIVPNLTLLDQWHLALVEDLHVQQDDIGCFSSQERSKTLKKINIFSINTARKFLLSLKNKEDFFLIVDECHRAGSASNSRALIGTYSATLGLSATPSRQYDDGFLRYIAPSLGKIIYEYDYCAALKDRVISIFELKNVQISFLKHEEQNYSKINKRLKYLIRQSENDNGVYTAIKKCLIQRSKLSIGALMRIPVTIKIAQQNKSERLLIFHENIASANEIYSLLARKKYPVALYHSKISPVLRRNNLLLYKKGIYNILITCKALDEGMNVPETTVAIISSSTASTRQRVQRLGRVLRPSPGKKKATIYTLYVTDQEKSRLLEEYKKLEEKIDITWLKAFHNGKDIKQ